MITEIKVPDNPDINVFVPFTRKWALTKFFEHLDNLDLPLSTTNFVFYNDTDNKEITDVLVEYLTNRSYYINGGLVYQSNSKPADEYDITKRRESIIDMREESKTLLNDDAPITFCLEDDTLPPHDAFDVLLKQAQDGYDLVSGIQVGRHAKQMIGAWRVTPVKKPTRVESIPYQAGGVVDVDGAGMYCYITTTSLYKAATYHSETECLGPDVCFGLDLRRQGLRVGANFDIICGHNTKLEGVLIPNEATCTVVWRKILGKWKQTR